MTAVVTAMRAICQPGMPPVTMVCTCGGACTVSVGSPGGSAADAGEDPTVKVSSTPTSVAAVQHMDGNSDKGFLATSTERVSMSARCSS
jgi:hypothetical protein